MVKVIRKFQDGSEVRIKATKDNDEKELYGFESGEEMLDISSGVSIKVIDTDTVVETSLFQEIQYEDKLSEMIKEFLPCALK